MKTSRSLDILAFTISGIFSPFLVITFMLILVSFFYLNGLGQIWPQVLIALFFLTIIPLASILILFKRKAISGIHLNKRADRVIPLLILIVSSLAALTILHSLHAPKNLLTIVTLVFIYSLIFWIITLFWKISMHASTLAGAITVLIFLLGPSLIWFYILIIPVGWSRIYRKSHTLLQILAGITLSIIMTVIVFNLFGYSFWTSYIK